MYHLFSPNVTIPATIKATDFTCFDYEWEKQNGLVVHILYEIWFNFILPPMKSILKYPKPPTVSLTSPRPLRFLTITSQLEPLKTCMKHMVS